MKRKTPWCNIKLWKENLLNTHYHLQKIEYNLQIDYRKATETEQWEYREDVKQWIKTIHDLDTTIIKKCLKMKILKPKKDGTIPLEEWESK